MAITPPLYAPSGSLMPTKVAASPYTYGNLPTTTSDYSIWGSKGNPYLTAGPTYTPGAGAPVVPETIEPALPLIIPGDSGSDYTDYSGSSATPEQQYGDLQSWLGRNKNLTRGGGVLLGAPLLDPAIDFAYGINPYTQKSLSWYDGSTDFDNNVNTDQNLNVNDYNAAIAAYDLDWQSGMTDLNQNEYVNQYLSERGKADATAVEPTSWWDSLWADTPEGESVGPVSFSNTNTDLFSSPDSYRNPTSVEALQAIAKIDSENQRVAANKAAIAAANAPVTYSQPVTFGSVANPIDGVKYGGVDPANNYSAGTVSSASSGGDVGYNDYGGGYYGFDDNGTEVGWEDPGGSDGGGPSGDSSYIATAATQSLGTAGLTVFNNWRDYMHSWHPTFTTSFGRYRVTAPKIVKAIDSKDNSKELYKEIWDEYLLPIHKLIVDKDNTNALIKYKVMVKELMNKYLKGKE